MPLSAGVVLVGGRSSRMGAPKAALEWHGSTLLWRTIAIIARATDGPVVVVRAPGQELPALPADAEVVDDPREGQGPVQGIAAGLRALTGRADVAFVSSTDMPFLHPAFVHRVVRTALDGADIGLPVARGFRQPLAASYRTALAPAAERLVAAGRLKPAFLYDGCEVAVLDETTLRADPVLAALDPDLDSVVNINEPADYLAARTRPAPEITVRACGVLASGRRGPELVRAATVAEAAAAVQLNLDRHVVAVLNGDRITQEGQTPLTSGDSVFFRSAEAGQ